MDEYAKKIASPCNITGDARHHLGARHHHLRRLRDHRLRGLQIRHHLRNLSLHLSWTGHGYSTSETIPRVENRRRRRCDYQLGCGRPESLAQPSVDCHLLGRKAESAGPRVARQLRGDDVLNHIIANLRLRHFRRMLRADND